MVVLVRSRGRLEVGLSIKFILRGELVQEMLSSPFEVDQAPVFLAKDLSLLQNLARGGIRILEVPRTRAKN